MWSPKCIWGPAAASVRPVALFSSPYVRRTRVAMGATLRSVAREISVRELRNHTADVIAAVRAGERLSLTVNRLPVADIVPRSHERDPWVRPHVLRSIVEEAGADADLLSDLADVRSPPVDGP